MAGPLTTGERLARLEARAEITDLVARYAHGADHKNDPAILGPLFAPDGVWTAEGFGDLRGREAIAAGLAEIAASRILWSIHYMVSPHVVLGDDAATARCHWYLWELCTVAEESGPTDSWFGGWYNSELALTDEGWRFTRVELEVRLQGEAMPPWTLKKAIPA
ncbi:nuclear transport factor 2 family protein [Novosphingobium album (ex Liu et al. 2023)]|uniref:Nuclear transport factor 2 family protein n=1 Tax=Novosphingobium album (ex Liu et al. 2023) TaxID=3031130 RepID=A0ABT5WQ55_9SPHN|nr:nuclear transport factor 2 family protein [Novosphingobium album (ex Liu et al. 2023)]MDE8652004.1 nuclear transport factor 2 family protein [Novosphingobium album (ex Liu et al. 2023)]